MNYLRTRENTECEIDHLEIFSTRDRRESVRACSDIKDKWLLKPRDKKMSPFADGSVNDSTESVKENSALASIDCVKRGVENGSGGADTECCASEVVKKGNRCLAATHCGRR